MRLGTSLYKLSPKMRRTLITISLEPILSLDGQIDAYVRQSYQLYNCSLYATPLSHAPTHPIGDTKGPTHWHWYNVHSAQE